MPEPSASAVAGAETLDVPVANVEDDQQSDLTALSDSESTNPVNGSPTRARASQKSLSALSSDELTQLSTPAAADEAVQRHEDERGEAATKLQKSTSLHLRVLVSQLTENTSPVLRDATTDCS